MGCGCGAKKKINKEAIQKASNDPTGRFAVYEKDNPGNILATANSVSEAFRLKRDIERENPTKVYTVKKEWGGQSAYFLL